MSSRVRIYMAMSLDGCIAGPNNDLSFLDAPSSSVTGPTSALSFEDFMAEVGVMLMGRTTHDVVAGMGVWAYGDTPVLVATTRPLQPASPTVQRVEGDITTLIAQAKSLAGAGDVYLDGGAVIRQALDAGLVDELCITVVPVVLGEGVRLFDGLLSTTSLAFTEHHSMGSMVQLTAVVQKD